MDIRIEKTRKAIQNSFLELRSKKELGKITVKELCERAMINKTTFYAHYRDIYDLSDQLETDVVNSVIDTLPEPKRIFEQPDTFTKDLLLGYMSMETLIKILFSGDQQSKLVQKIDQRMRDLIFTAHPELKDDQMTNVLLTYTIYGSYYAFYENKKSGELETVNAICQITDEILKLL